MLYDTGLVNRPEPKNAGSEVSNRAEWGSIEKPPGLLNRTLITRRNDPPTAIVA
jgi:hypothetical protein